MAPVLAKVTDPKRVPSVGVEMRQRLNAYLIPRFENSLSQRKLAVCGRNRLQAHRPIGTTFRGVNGVTEALGLPHEPQLARITPAIIANSLAPEVEVGLIAADPSGCVKVNKASNEASAEGRITKVNDSTASEAFATREADSSVSKIYLRHGLVLPVVYSSDVAGGTVVGNVLIIVGVGTGLDDQNLQ